MQENVQKMLEDAGVKVVNSNARGYRPTVPLPNYDVKLLKVRLARVSRSLRSVAACLRAAPPLQVAANRSSWIAAPHCAPSLPRSLKTSWACSPPERAMSGSLARTGWKSWALRAS